MSASKLHMCVPFKRSVSVEYILVLSHGSPCNPDTAARDGWAHSGMREKGGGDEEERESEKERSTGNQGVSSLHLCPLSRSCIPNSHLLFPQFLFSRLLKHREGLTLRLHLTADGHGQEERWCVCVCVVYIVCVCVSGRCSDCHEVFIQLFCVFPLYSHRMKHLQ